MLNANKILKYFSITDYILWCSSLTIVLVTYIVFKTDTLSFFASIIGITALIICAKGNPIGQVFMIAFCIMYSIISLSFNYYGELITYAGMSLPAAILSLISWLKHPSDKGKSEVKVNTLIKRDYLIISLFTIVVTIAFYFILKALNTSNLIVSTISVATSFFAVFLTFKRSPLFALAYALNDVVLIVLWTFATFTNLNYLSTVIIFATFLVNDVYGYICWIKMQKRQNKTKRLCEQ